MPYILQNRRDKLDPFIEKLQKSLLNLGLKEGDLNYVVTRLVAFYFKNETRYSGINKVVGVLENVKSEFSRRCADEYEDKVCRANGDIPEFWECKIGEF